MCLLIISITSVILALLTVIWIIIIMVNRYNFAGETNLK